MKIDLDLASLLSTQSINKDGEESKAILVRTTRCIDDMTFFRGEMEGSQELSPHFFCMSLNLGKQYF